MTPQSLIQNLSEPPAKLYEWKCEGLREPNRDLAFTQHDWTNVETDVLLSADGRDQFQTHTLIKELIVTATPALSASYNLRLTLNQCAVFLEEQLAVLAERDSHEFDRPQFLRRGTLFTPVLLKHAPFDGDRTRQKISIEIYGWEVSESTLDLLLKQPVREHIHVVEG
jgi:hypothetical protein